MCAVIAGMFMLSVLAMLPFTNGAFTKSCNEYYGGMVTHGIGSSLIGGTLMGLGMTLSGSVVFTLLYCFSNWIPVTVVF